MTLHRGATAHNINIKPVTCQTCQQRPIYICMYVCVAGRGHHRRGGDGAGAKNEARATIGAGVSMHNLYVCILTYIYTLSG